MFPLRLNLSLVTSIKLKNFSNLKAVLSDDKCIMLFDREVVSFCFSYGDDNVVKKNSQLTNAFTLLLKLLYGCIFMAHTFRKGEEKINLLENQFVK